MEQINKLLKDLENEISSEKFIKLYKTIRDKYPPIKDCFTPEDLIGRLNNQSDPDYRLNDEILSALILEYQSHQEKEQIGSYLLVLFKPGLLKLFSQYRIRIRQFSSISEVDLWDQIIAYFLQTVSEIDLIKDEIKVASKIIGRLRNRLRNHFVDLLKEFTTEQEFNRTGFNASPPDPFNFEDVHSVLTNIARLGVISETDKHILLATKVYGSSMKKLSQELKGLSYDAIRQRRARAQKAISIYMKQKSEKT